MTAVIVQNNMAQFISEQGILLTAEEEKNFSECREWLNADSYNRHKRKTNLPNLRKAIEDNFIGWEVKI